MQQAVQNTSSPLERNLTVSVPVAEIEKEIAARLKKLAQTVRMEGFRPGKVPLKMVERHYGYQVRQEVLNDSVQRSFIDAVKNHNYRVAGFPRFQPVQAGQGAAAPTSIDFTATFEVYPEVNMGDLAGTKLSRPLVKVGDEKKPQSYAAVWVGESPKRGGRWDNNTLDAIKNLHHIGQALYRTKVRQVNQDALVSRGILQAPLRGLCVAQIHIAVDEVVDHLNMILDVEFLQRLLAQIFGDGRHSVAFLN